MTITATVRFVTDHEAKFFFSCNKTLRQDANGFRLRFSTRDLLSAGKGLGLKAENRRTGHCNAHMVSYGIFSINIDNYSHNRPFRKVFSNVSMSYRVMRTAPSRYGVRGTLIISTGHGQFLVNFFLILPQLRLIQGDLQRLGGPTPAREYCHQINCMAKEQGGRWAFRN